MRIRAGVAADLDAMYELDVTCFEPPFRFSRAAMWQFMQAAGAFSLVAETADAAFVGFLVVQVVRSRGRVEGYVVTLDVAADARRSGVAALLMASAERQVRERSGTSVGLHVWTDNAAAILFYESIGFKKTQLHTGFYDEKLNAWGYRKELLPTGGGAPPSAGD